MNMPVNSLDERYSDRDAAAIGWDETRRLLESAQLFWITTVRADGRPHVTPLVAVWVDDAIHFHCSEKQPASRKRRNQLSQVGRGEVATTDAQELPAFHHRPDLPRRSPARDKLSPGHDPG